MKKKSDAHEQIRKALTTKGKARLQILERAVSEGTAADPQFLDLYLKALDDRYSDLARFVAMQILPLYGAKLVAKLKPLLNLNGKTADGWGLVALALTDRKTGVKLCQKALQEGTPAIRQAALVALTELSAAEARSAAFALLQERIGAPLRRAALNTLVNVGPSTESFPLLINIVRGSNPEYKYLARRILEAGGKEAAELLTPLLADSTPIVRLHATWTLIAIGPQASPAISQLRDNLRSSDFSTACSASSCLGAIGPAASEAINDLTTLLKHPQIGFRLSVAEALFKITGKAKPSLPALIAGVESDDPEVNRDASLIIAEMGLDALAAGPALVRAIKDRNRRWRHFSAEALAAIGYDPPTVIPLLIDMLDDAEPYCEQLAAVRALGCYGSVAAEALPKLEELQRRKRGKYYQEALVPAIAAIRGKLS